MPPQSTQPQQVSFINPKAILNIVDGQSMVVATTNGVPQVFTLVALQKQLVYATALTTQINAAIALIPVTTISQA